jgi:hypothetical protein
MGDCVAVRAALVATVEERRSEAGEVMMVLRFELLLLGKLWPRASEMCRRGARRDSFPLHYTLSGVQLDCFSGTFRRWRTQQWRGWWLGWCWQWCRPRCWWRWPRWWLVSDMCLDDLAMTAMSTTAASAGRGCSCGCESLVSGNMIDGEVSSETILQALIV